MEDEAMEISSEDDMLGPSDPEDEGQEGIADITAAELLKRLEKGWLNEKLCPELLIPLTEEVECMQDQLISMEGNLKNVPKTDIRLSIHKMEMARIRYVLVSYLRTRLFKIQEFAWHVQDSENKRRESPKPRPSKLMEQEHKFLTEYLENLEGQLTSVGTQGMPHSFQILEGHKMMWGPNADKFVFFRVKKENRILLDDAYDQKHEVHLEVGDQQVMRYKPVARLLHEGSIELM